MTTQFSLNSLKICCYIQYVLLSFSFYLFSSKISFLPWYIPLTTYVLLYLIILTLLQILLLLYTWSKYEKQINFKYARRICLIHFLLLLFMCFLCIFSVTWFHLFSFLSLLLIIFLIIYQKKTTRY